MGIFITNKSNLIGRKLHSETWQHNPKWRASILRFHSEQGCHDNQGLAPENQEKAERWEIRVRLHKGYHVKVFMFLFLFNKLKHT